MKSSKEWGVFGKTNTVGCSKLKTQKGNNSENNTLLKHYSWQNVVAELFLIHEMLL